MDKRRPIQLLTIGIGLFFTVIVVLIIVRHFNSKPQSQTIAGYRILSREEMAQSDQAGNVLPSADTLHIFTIQDNVAKTRSISEENLDWLLLTLKANSLPGQRKELARVRLLEPLKALTNIPALQKEKIFDAVVPMLGNDPAFADPLDKSEASTIMRIIDDKRAVLYLVPLLGNPDEEVRLHAQHALSVIGYKSS